MNILAEPYRLHHKLFFFLDVTTILLVPNSLFLPISLPHLL